MTRRFLVPFCGLVPMFIIMLLFIAGAITFSYTGFAVDAENRIYVGTDGRILVCEGGKVVRTVTTGTDRGYAFTIQDGDKIVLSTSTDILEMDLYGKVLRRWKDTDSEVFDRYRRNDRFCTPEGIEYNYKNHWGRTRIYSGGRLVYQMPLVDYILKIYFLLSVGVFVFGVFYCLMDVPESKRMLLAIWDLRPKWLR